MELNKDWIEEWTKRYDDTHIDERTLETRILKSIKNIQSPEDCKNILIEIAKWKAGKRILHHIQSNDDGYIVSITKVSLDAYKEHNERLMLNVLTLLKGVKIRMASAILYFRFPDKYTIMDWRAWESLKSFKKIGGDISEYDNFDGWKKYNDVCSHIAEQFGVSLRELDKALWQYGKENLKNAPKEARSNRRMANS